MNNDEWIAFQDRIPPEHRWIFDQTRAHDDEAYGSMMHAMLLMMTSVENKVDQAITSWQADATDRKQIAIGLDLIITEIGKLSGDVTELRTAVATLQRGQLHGDKERAAMAKRLNKIEQELATLQKEVAIIKAAGGA